MNLNVLIIDDDSVNRFLLRKRLILSEFHDDPQCFENGLVALNYLTNSSLDGEIVIFLDINMPIMNGWDFLDKIENTNLSKKIKVFIISSSVDKSELQKANHYNTILKTFPKPILNHHITLIKNELMAS